MLGYMTRLKASSTTMRELVALGFLKYRLTKPKSRAIIRIIKGRTPFAPIILICGGNYANGNIAKYIHKI